MATLEIKTKRSLSKTLEKAKGGDVLVLEGGDWGPLVIQGKNYGKGITITSKDSKNPASFESLKIVDSKGIELNKLILDYDFKAGEPDYHKPFIIRSSDKIKITNSVIAGDFDPKTRVGTGFGITVNDTSGFTLKNTEIHSFMRGALIYESKDIVITGNDVHSIRSDGMNFVENNNILIKNNYFHDFDAQRNTNDHRDMVQFWTATTKTPSKNIRISENVFDIGKGSWTQSLFMRNEEVDSKGAGKKMYYQNVVIDNNIIYNYHLHGITVGETNKLVIRDNSVIQAVGDKRAIGNSKIKGSVTEPMINVAEGSTNVKIQGNFARKINGHENQSGWSVSKNVEIPPSAYGKMFTSESMKKGAPHNYVKKKGTAISGIGADDMLGGGSGLDTLQETQSYTEMPFVPPYLDTAVF